MFLFYFGQLRQGPYIVRKLFTTNVNTNFLIIHLVLYLQSSKLSDNESLFFLFDS